MSDVRVIVDDKLKANAETVLKSLDLTMSQAVRMFLKQVVRAKELPFNPYQRKFNTETEAAMLSSMDDKNLISHSNIDEMFKEWDEE